MNAFSEQNPSLSRFFILILLSLNLSLWGQAAVKIMPLGNSITFDYNSFDKITPRPDGDRISYRYQLYNSLQSLGYTFDFVGSEESGGNYLPSASPDYTDNAGFPGYTAGEILSLLQTGENKDGDCEIGTCDGSYLQFFNPDIILLHLGTNGLETNTDAENISQSIEDILNEVDNYEAAVGKTVPVFLARIINRAGSDPSGNHAVTTYYNGLLANLVTSRTSDELILTDMENGALLDYRLTSDGGDMADNLHPAVSGYNKMGLKWTQSLESYNITPPVVADIQDQMANHSSEITIMLDDHVFDPQEFDSDMDWNVSGASNLQVTIDPASRIVTITAINPAWTGSELITFTATDPFGSSDSDQATFTLYSTNENPTDIELAPASLNENVPLNTAVGTLTTTDPDAGDTFEYTLAAGAGDTDNSSFTISGNTLQTNTEFDFEAKSSYAVRVRSTDNNGGFFEKSFLISVNDVNESPTDLLLSNSTIGEDQPVNTLVGTLSSTDPESGDSHTYSLVSGSGDADNSSFHIDGNQLLSSSIFDYETKSAYTVRISTTDGVSAPYEKSFGITVTFNNQPPTDISLSNSVIPENLPVSSVVGTYTTTDPNPGDSHNYTMVDGIGGDDNTSFSNDGNQLKTAVALDYETKSSYSIRVKSTDLGGSSVEEAFPLTVTDINEAPTDIALSNASLAENSASGIVIGTFTTTDPDAGDTHTYSFGTGTGDTDNASFSISGNQLLSAASFNFEAQSSYSVRIRATDLLSSTYEEAFTISVTDLNESPTDIQLSNSTIGEDQPVNTLVGTLSSTDPESGDPHTYSLVAGSGDADNSSFHIDGNQLLSSSIFDYETKSAYTVRISTTDGVSAPFEKTFGITVTFNNQPPTDIALSNSAIPENQPVSSVIGAYTTTDPNPGDSHIYTMVAGAGGDDNSSFSNDGNQLKTAAALDYETKSSYSIRVKSTDLGGSSVEEAFPLTVTDINEAPTDITLSNTSLAENSASGTVVGAFTTTDPDVGDTHTYSFSTGTGDTDNASFSISGNQLLSAASFNFEAQSSYSVRISTTDLSTSTYTEVFTISVTNQNENPTDIALSNTTIAENMPVNTVVGNLSATDPDAGSSFTYSLVPGTGSIDNASFNILGTQLRSSAVFDYETKSSYSIRLSVSDGLLTFEEAFTVAVTFANDAPTNITLTGNSIAENQLANTVVGTLSTTDPNSSDTHTYSLIAGAGDTDNSSFNISGNQLRSGAPFDFENKSSYSVRIRTTDNLGATFDEAFTISVTNVNEAPVDIALSNNTIAENMPVNTVVGNLSATDPDAGSSFTYSLVPGTGSTDNASFNILGTQLRSSAVFDYETKSSYSIRLSVSDGSLTFEEEFTVTVTFANDPPTNITLTGNSIAENQPVNTVVGTLTTTDPNSSDTHTYSLIAGAGDTDNASFNLNGNQLRANGPFNYESKSSYTVRIRTTDNLGATFDKAFSINITNVNEAPTDISLSNNIIAENLPINTVIGTLSTTDPDAGSTFTYALVPGTGGTDNASFNISGSQLRTSAVLDYETKSSLSIRLSVSDGELNFEEIFTITVTFANETPTNITLTGNSIAENQAVNTVVGTLSTTDANSGDTHIYTLVGGAGSTDNTSFNISGNQLRANAPLNFETKSSYSVRIRTTDNQGAYYEKAFTITVTNVNEAPTDLSLSNTVIAESLPVNTVIGNLSATDPDAGSTFTYTLVPGTGSTDNASFNISGSQLRSSVVFDYETKPSCSIRLSVSDQEFTFEKVFTITITFVNEAPTDITLSGNTLAENLIANAVVGNLSTTDPNSGDTHVYALVSGTGSGDNSSFNISGNQLRANAPLNFEVKSTYSVRIRTTDNLGLTYSKAFSITVTDVNEAPTDITLSASTIAENLPVNTVIGTFAAVDPDVANTHTFSLVSGIGDTDNASFNIAGAQLRSSASFDFETKASYSIRVRASDGTLGYEEAFTITVTNINDAPVLANVEPSALSYTEGAGILPVTSTITVTDADNVNLTSATIQITSGLTLTEDFLRYTAQDGITGSYTAATGTYSLSGTATKAQYQAALRRIGYENTNILNPSTVTRVVSFTVSDGSLPSNVVTRSITVNSTNSAPVISAMESAPLSYCPKSGPVVISSALIPADADNLTLSSAVVRITTGLTPAEDRLRFTDQNNITHSYNSTTGVLTLTGVSAIANYQTALRSVRYENINLVNPVAATRTIAFTVNDGIDNSVEVTRNIVVNPLIKALFSPYSQEICNDGITTAGLGINLSAGTAPWTVVVSRYRPSGSGGAWLSDTTFSNIFTEPFTVQVKVVSPYPSTLYRIKSLTDASSCPGDTTGSGTATVAYKLSPVAVISGIDTICPAATGSLQVSLTGTGPWSITYLRNGGSPTVINNIGNTGDVVFNYSLPVTQTGTYTLSQVQDAICTGKVSGQGIVRAYVAPTAIISGNATICEHTSTNLNIALTGTAPWKFSYRRDAETPVVIPNIYSSPQVVPVQTAGTYTLFEVFDKNCRGTVSGSAIINVTPAPEVVLSGLAPAYNKQSTDWIPITGTPTGGTFSGPGIIPYNLNWYFVPSLPPVGTHNIVYSYRVSSGSCWGYDTAVVRVLEANAVIEFENNRTKYCLNDPPFTVTGANLANAIGSFTISGGAGLFDNHDNTATVYPEYLTQNEYTITYTYFDGTTLSVTSKFDVGNSPVADFKWDTECFHTGQSINLINTSASTFGNITANNWKIYTSTGFESFTTKDVNHTFPEAGNHNIELQIETSYGCKDTKLETFSLRPTINLAEETFEEDFELRPLSWRSGTAETPPVNSWMLDDPSTGFTGAASGQYCWYTYIPGPASLYEKSYVTSPCFDFTGIEKPMLKLNIWRLFNSNRDGANIQASADSGKSWTLIGQIGDGVKWYNSYNIRGNPGGSGIGWSNNDGLQNDVYWVEARHALDMLKGKTEVQFRINYGSDGTAQGNHGIAFDDFWIGERNRMALLEHFTNSSSESCETANTQINSFVNANELNVLDLQYHTSFPGPDPFNQDNPAVPGARVFYYGLSKVPYTILDGGSKSQHRFDYDTRPFDPNTALVESLLDSKFLINLNSHVYGNTLNIEAEVYARENIPATELTVHLAVIEQVITGVTGSNGETSFESVVKTMLPDAAGTTIYQAWNLGDYRFIGAEWDMQNVVRDLDQLRVAAFIQNETTGEVYQAAVDTIGTFTGIQDDRPQLFPEKSFIVYPNPVQNTAYIKFNATTTEDITVELYNNVGGLVLVQQVPEGTDKAEIRVDDFPDGFYLLRLVSRNQLIGIVKLAISK